MAWASDRELTFPVVAGGGAALLLLGAGVTAMVGRRASVDVAEGLDPARSSAKASATLVAYRSPAARVSAVVSASTGLAEPVRVVSHRARVLPAPVRVVVQPARLVSPPPRVVRGPGVVVARPRPTEIVPERAGVSAEAARAIPKPSKPDPMAEPAQSQPTLIARYGPELRSPLHAILGLGEALRDETAGRLSAGQKAYVEDILMSGRRLLRLVNNVCDLARLEAGTCEFHAEPVSPEALVRDICDIVHPLAVRKRITILTEIDPALAEVVVDAATLRQVLFERVADALQASPAYGQIMIRVSPETSGTFRIAVGAGGVDRWVGSGGLAAALEQAVVEAQGGRVGVTHDEDKNAVFFAILPRSS